MVITCWLKAQMAQTSARCSGSSDPRSLSDRLTNKYRNLRKPQQAEEALQAGLMQKAGNLGVSERPEAPSTDPRAVVTGEVVGVAAEEMGKGSGL